MSNQSNKPKDNVSLKGSKFKNHFDELNSVFDTQKKSRLFNTIVIAVLSVLFGMLFLSFYYHECLKPEKNNIIMIMILVFFLIVACIFGLIALIKMYPLLEKSNDQQNKMLERLVNAEIKSIEDEEEYGRFHEKTKVELIERYAKTLMDEDAKNGDNQRKLAIMQQEYVSHLADIALEMVKSKSNNNGQDQVSDQQMINQIIQQLIRQSNGQQ